MSSEIKIVKGQIWTDQIFKNIIDKNEVSGNIWIQESYLIFLWIQEKNKNNEFPKIVFINAELSYFSLLAIRFGIVKFNFELGQFLESFSSEYEKSLLKFFQLEIEKHSSDVFLRNTAIQKKKKVSLCISTYNRAHNFLNLLQGIFAQTRLPDEIVIVDDGSDDENKITLISILEQFRSRAHIIHQYQDNKGNRIARNRAANFASGDILVFLDDDNFPKKNMIENFCFGLENLNYDIVVAPYERVFTSSSEDPLVSSSPYKKIWTPIGPCSDLLPFENCVGDMNLAVLRAVFDEVGGLDEKTKYSCEDWLFLVRSFLKGKKIGVCPEVTQIYRDHPTSFYKTSPKLLGELEVLAEFSKYLKAPSSLLLEIKKSHLSSDSVLNSKAKDSLKIEGDYNQGYHILVIKPLIQTIFRIWSFSSQKLQIKYFQGGKEHSFEFDCAMGFRDLKIENLSNGDSLDLFRSNSFFLVEVNTSESIQSSMT